MVAPINRLKPANTVLSDIRRKGHRSDTSTAGFDHDVRAVTSAVHVPPRFRTILVPLDGSSLGERALPLAVSIARRAGAELRVVHVHAPIESVHYPYPRFDTGERKQKMEYLNRITRQIKDAGVRVVPRYLEHRLVAKALCAAGQNVDLVVAATHGYGWLGRLWHGSIIDELMNGVTTPLLILRGNGLPAAIAPEQWLRRVLVSLDGSPRAETALTAGMALGTLYDADYSLVSVVRDRFAERQFLRADTAHRLSAAQHYLWKTARRIEHESRQANLRLSITSGPVAQKIVSLAESMNADCIAIARGSRASVMQWLRPSVTRRVLQLAQSPVLVVNSTVPDQTVAGDVEHSSHGQATGDPP